MLRDGLNGPRGANELFRIRCGTALTVPQLVILQTFLRSSKDQGFGQFFDIQGATELSLSPHYF